MDICLSLDLVLGSRLRQLKRALLRLIKSSYTKLLNPNSFPPRTVQEDMSRTTAERLGQWSTRFSIVLVTSSLALLALQISIKL